MVSGRLLLHRGVICTKFDELNDADALKCRLQSMKQ